MESLFSGPVVVWGIVILTVAVLLSAGLAWRTRYKLKRATHYFPKYQAEIKWQMYTSVTAVLVMLLGLLLGYYWLGGLYAQTSKVAEAQAEMTVESDVEATPRATRRPTRPPSSTRQTVPTREPVPTKVPVLDLSAEYNQIEPRVELTDDIEISNMQFSVKVTDEYRPINPTQTFPLETQIIYATFDYKNMEDGLVWSWLWRRNGNVIEADNELWKYGDDGPGYLFLSPAEGLPSGKYSAEIWINGELFMRQQLGVGIEQEVLDANAAFIQNGRTLVQEVADTDSLTDYAELTRTPTPPEEIVTIQDALIVNGRVENAKLPSRYRAASTESISDTVVINILRFSADINIPACPQTDPCPDKTVFSLSAAFHPIDVPPESILTYIWRYNGAVLKGQSEPWTDEESGVEYLTLTPENGLISGEYALEIWANNVRFSQASLVVNRGDSAKIE